MAVSFSNLSPNSLPHLSALASCFIDAFSLLSDRPVTHICGRYPITLEHGLRHVHPVILQNVTVAEVMDPNDISLSQLLPNLDTLRFRGPWPLWTLNEVRKISS
jgi:hypothetical protein